MGNGGVDVMYPVSFATSTGTLRSSSSRDMSHSLRLPQVRALMECPRVQTLENLLLARLHEQATP